MIRFLSVLFVVAGIGGPVQAQPADSTSSATPDTAVTSEDRDADWLILPYASYSPDTKFAIGAVVGYYLPAHGDRPPSDVQLTLTATQRRQFIAEVTPELYLNGGQWRVSGSIVASKYPNSFYGIGGDTPPSAEESYTARFGLLDMAVQRTIWSHLRAGPHVFARLGTITESEEGGRLDRAHVPGSEGGTVTGLGGSVLWDARDNIYYPTKNTYAELSATWHSSLWGGDYTFGQLVADLRWYRPTGPGVLATQVYTETITGQAPFELLPLLGGSERMRGYREGRFRDDIYWTTQAEYRFPVWWRFKGSAFVTAGEVGPRVGPALADQVELAVGIGGRLRLTENGDHGRLDVAYSETGLEVYMSLGEAF